MGQSKFAWGCALVAGAIVANRLTAEEPNPFDGEQVEAGPVQDMPRSRHEAERRIEAILDQPLRNPIDALQTPLIQITDIIEEEFGFPIEYDIKALDVVAASPDTEVNAAYSNLSLRSALELMLRQVEHLTYVVDNEVLLITTQEEAGRRLETRVYRVDDLIVVDPSQSALSASADYDSLIALITANVEHDSWTANGKGEGEVRAFPPGMIVITQTRRVHDQVDELLTELRRNKAEVLAAAETLESAGGPVTRSFRFSDATLAESAQLRATVEQALQQSVDWETDGEQLADGVFLHVLPEQVIVRHVPKVVAQVEQAVREILPQQQRGYFGGRRGGGMAPARGGGF